jgi:hypothetical protein
LLVGGIGIDSVGLVEPSVTPEVRGLKTWTYACEVFGL